LLFLNVRDQVSHPYKTTGRIMVLHILTFKFLHNRRAYFTLPQIKNSSNKYSMFVTKFCTLESEANMVWTAISC
jgi:hypothetical protein